MMIKEGLPANIGHLDGAPHIRLANAQHIVEENGSVVSMTAIFHDDRPLGGATGILYIERPGQPDAKKYATPFQNPETTTQLWTRISLLQSLGQEVTPESVPELKQLPKLRQPNRS